MLVWSLARALGSGVYCLPDPSHERRSWWLKFVLMGSGVSLNKLALWWVEVVLLLLFFLYRWRGVGEQRKEDVVLHLLRMKEGDGGPEAGRWSAGVGSASLLSGRLDPVRDELGARRRPIRLHWLVPSRRRWWILRLSNALGLGVHLVPGMVVACFFLLRRLAGGGVRQVDWWFSSLVVLVLFLAVCVLAYVRCIVLVSTL